jgi:hypothetical protein
LIPPFSEADTFKTINSSKYFSAVKPDGLTAVHLKHIGPKAHTYLTQSFYLLIFNAYLPAIWEAAVIVPVLKPGKPATDGTSYHPISLLSPCVKIFERLLLPNVTAACPKQASQHIFAPDHSCTTALLPIVTQIAIGFSQPKPAKRSGLCIMTTPFSSRKSLSHHSIQTLSGG